jgi:hypothetical protein
MRAALAWLVCATFGAACAASSPKAGRGGDAGPSAAASAAPLAAAPTPSPSTQPATATLPVLQQAAHGWQVGRRYGYRMTLGNKVGFGGEVATDFELSGELRLTCTSNSADVTTLRAELAAPRVASKLATEQAQLEQGLRELASPVMLTLKSGTVSELRFAPGMKPSAVNTYRALAAALQLARPLGQSQRWQARERDATGEYLAEYRRKAGLVHKQKLRYLSLLVPAADRQQLPAGLLPEVVSSRSELRTSDDGRRALVVELQEELALKQLQAPMFATNRVSLQWITEEAASKEEQQQPEHMVVLRPDEVYRDQASAEMLDEARIGGMSFEAISAELDALSGQAPLEPATDAGDGPRREQATQRLQHLIIALAATFRQQPQTIELALAKIRAGAPNRDALLDALAASGNDQSQLALIQLLDSPHVDRDRRHAAAFALSRTPKPGTAAIRALSAQLDDEFVGTQALYGLGTFCRLLRETGDVRASEELGQLLMRRLAAADGENAVTRTLRAISNSGFAPALGLVKPLLDDGREAVRADALEAIRLMDSPEVDGLIAKRLAADPSVKVQMAALSAIKARKPTAALVQALSGAARATDTHVRYRATELAAAWLERRPELRPSLEHVARQDGEEKIRRLASAALSGASKRAAAQSPR